MTSSIMDYETKYIASNSRALVAKSWLEANFPSDPQYPEAIISSIYFDTWNLKYLGEKQESDHIKSKFRIRWYQDIKTKVHSDVCFLEFKHKIGEHRDKRRIDRPNDLFSVPLESSAFFEVLNDLRVYKGKVLENIYPCFVISYTRKRFIIPNTEHRLCIDYNINVPKVNLNLVRGTNHGYLSQCVFELKGPSAVLPNRLITLEKLGFQKDSFSKYDRCFEELIL